MSQNPHRPHSSEEKLSALEDDQESLDNSIRKRIQQSVPGSHRDDTPKCKQNCPLFKKNKKKVQFCVFCSGDDNGVL